jgi:hypothetical protein
MSRQPVAPTALLCRRPNGGYESSLCTNDETSKEERKNPPKQMKGIWEIKEKIKKSINRTTRKKNRKRRKVRKCKYRMAFKISGKRNQIAEEKKRKEKKRK